MHHVADAHSKTMDRSWIK